MNLHIMSSERLKDIWLLCIFTGMFCDKFLSSNLYYMKSNGPSTAEIYGVLAYLYLPQRLHVAKYLNYLSISAFVHSHF